ncbi:MAG: Smr/MutS family protein [Bacteroidota bacterium]
MNYRIGQRVRLLHASGEGVIVNLIDKKTVEVDMGDDFPVDVSVDEIIPIDRAEAFYLGDEEKTPEPEKKTNSLKTTGTLGISLIELSLVVYKYEDEDLYEVLLINPEPVTMAFTCYGRTKNAYQGLETGLLETGEYAKIASFSRNELDKHKSFYVQTLSFRPGKGHPHAPFVQELPWNRSHLQKPSRYLSAINQSGWVFNLRQDVLKRDVQQIPESEFIRIKEIEAPTPRLDVEVDLHIEALVSKPHQLAPSEMLSIQQKRIEKALNDAVIERHASLVLIHGVGEGKLRKVVQAAVKEAPHVLSYAPADPKRYGNGATKVIFK